MKKWDEKTIAFAAKTEGICDAYMNYLTGHTQTQWFTSLTKSPLNNRTDYKSIDSKYRRVTIELKNRDITINQYNSIMIEPDKFSALCQTGSTSELTDCSWYLNFMDNDKTKFWIVDIKKIMHKNIFLKKDVLITNKELGAEYSYKEDRLLIPKMYGHYYELDNITNKYKQLW